MRPTRPRLRWTALALCAYALLVLAMGPGLLDSSLLDLGDDYLEYGVTDFAFVADEVRQGRLPTWNPYKHGGGSVFGELSRMSSHYPVILLLGLLPLDLVLLLVWLLHLALGALGVDRLARELGAGTAGGAAGGVAWLLGSHPAIALVDGMLDNLPFFALVPWAMVFVLRANHALLDPDAPRARALVHAVMAASCMGLIGLGAHTRFAAISFAAVGLGSVVLWLVPPSGRRPPAGRLAGVVAITLGAGTLLALPVLWPTLLEISATRSTPTGEGEVLIGQALTWRGLTGLVHPWTIYLDERWHHVGAGLLLCLLTFRLDRRGRAALITGCLLVLLGMGARGPLFLLARPFHWLLYPVETGVAGLGLPFLSAAVGVAVDRLVRPAKGDHGGPRRGVVVAAAGLTVTALGWLATRSLYAPEVTSVQPIQLESALHGGAAVLALAGAVALSGRLRGQRLAVLLVTILVADGLIFAWRVQALLPSPAMRPSEFVTPDAALDDLEPGAPAGRVLQWPLRPIRDFSGCLDDRTRTEGHGWGHTPWFDPLAVPSTDARFVLAGPLRRNAGSRSGLLQVGGRAKVPPVPWSVFARWLSTAGPTDLQARRYVDPDANDPTRLPAPPETVAVGWTSGEADDDGRTRPAWAVGGAPGPCDQGPLGLGPEDESRWIPRLLELMHVRWVVSPFPLSSFPGTRPIDPRGEAKARFEVIDPRPQALLSVRVRRVPSMGEAEQLIFGSDLNLRRSPVVIGPTEGDLPDRDGAAVEVEVADWWPGGWELRPPAGGGLITVTERYHPGWVAQDGDGHHLEVMRANFVQLAVLLPSETTAVRLRFVAPGTEVGRTGGIIGLAGLMGLLGLGLCLGRRAHRAR
jgi:hypothetical protein